MSFLSGVRAKLRSLEMFVVEPLEPEPILKPKESPSNCNTAYIKYIISHARFLAVSSDASRCFSVVMFKQSTEPLLASNPSYINISRLP